MCTLETITSILVSMCPQWDKGKCLVKDGVGQHVLGVYEGVHREGTHHQWKTGVFSQFFSGQGLGHGKWMIPCTTQCESLRIFLA